MSVETVLHAVLLELKDSYAKATRLQRAMQHLFKAWRVVFSRIHSYKRILRKQMLRFQFFSSSPRSTV